MVDRFDDLREEFCELRQDPNDPSGPLKPSIRGRTSVRVGHRVVVLCSFLQEDTPGYPPMGPSHGMLEIDLSKNTWRGMIDNRPSVGFGRSCLYEDKIIWVGSMDWHARLGDGMTVAAYDLVTDDWTSLPVLGSAPSVRAAFSLDYMEEQEICVIFGGFASANRTFSEVHLFDLERLRWVQPVVKGTPKSLAYHDTCVHNGTIYCYGGYGPDGLCSELHMLELVSKREVRWSMPRVNRLGRNPFGLVHFALASFRDVLLLLGGYGRHEIGGVHIYDPKTGELSGVHPGLRSLAGTDGISVSGIPLDGGNTMGVFGISDNALGYLRIS